MRNDEERRQGGDEERRDETRSDEMNRRRSDPIRIGDIKQVESNERFAGGL